MSLDLDDETLELLGWGSDVSDSTTHYVSAPKPSRTEPGQVDGRHRRNWRRKAAAVDAVPLQEQPWYTSNHAAAGDRMTPAIESLKEQFPRNSPAADLVEIHERTIRAQQGFFAGLAAEARKPHFGGMQRDWVNALLLRAIEANLYDPERDS